MNLLRHYFKLINFINLKINKVNINYSYSINGLLYIRNSGQLYIGKYFKCNSGNNFNPIFGNRRTDLCVQKNGNIRIGNNVGISNSTIYCSKQIIIGNNVNIGGGCNIWDTDFHSLDPYTRIYKDESSINSKEIKICDNVFIGAGSIILKGVCIEKNSIIGAGSVVTKNVPPNEIWAGNPIKFIKKVPLSHDF